jgi:ribosomal protein L7Ae-like RNA K-turn-binding protein
MKIDKITFVIVEHKEYLGKTVTVENSIVGDIKSKCSQAMFAVIRCRMLCLTV